MTRSKSQEVIELVRQAGILRPRDLQRHGIAREYLRRLHRQGLLERPARGLYRLPDAEVTEKHSLAMACKQIPRGVVCLLSALQFHELGTQAPFEVWMAIDVRARSPKQDDLPLRIVRFSGKALEAGVEAHLVEDVSLRIYGVAKTVADCFKFRNKIGLDVALEALRDAWRQKLVSMDELWRYGQICRVSRVMQPYLESLT